MLKFMCGRAICFANTLARAAICQLADTQLLNAAYGRHHTNCRACRRGVDVYHLSAKLSHMDLSKNAKSKPQYDNAEIIFGSA